MSQTVWTKNAKEGFFEETKNEQNENFTDKLTDETILMGSKSETRNEQPLTNAKKTSEPSLFSRINNLQKEFNQTEAKQIYVDFIKYMKKYFNDTTNVMGSGIIGLFHTKNDSPEAKRDKKILKSQIYTLISVLFISYFFVVNWWYYMCYTNFVIDFRDFILPSLHWSLSPPLNAIELINYYMFTFRMDKNATFPMSIETARELWNWRPVTFSLLHLLTYLLVKFFPIAEIIESTMLSTGALFTLISGLSIYYFFTLWVKEEWHKKFLTNTSIFVLLIFCGLIIVSFVCMFLFISFACPTLLIYILALSYLSIFIFNGPFSVISVYKQIFQELKEAPVNTPNPISKLDKLQNTIFQNFHSIYILIILIVILISHIQTALQFSSNSLVFMAIFLNLLICVCFAWNSFAVIPNLLKIMFYDTTDLQEKNDVAPVEREIRL